MQWQQHTCLLTGASGGIGQAIAQALANKGVRLILQGRDKARLQSLQNALGAEHRILVADINTEQGRQTIKQSILQTNGISMLINNAGVGQFSLLEATNQVATMDTLITNLLAPILLTQELLPLLKKAPQAYLVNVGSTLGSIGLAGQTIYCASKFGLRGFTEALHRELADANIQVTYFAPRATATAINSAQAMAMNSALGHSVDAPDKVAELFIKQLENGHARQFVGFAETLFAKINGAFPQLVDRALLKKLPIIKRFARHQTDLQQNPPKVLS